LIDAYFKITTCQRSRRLLDIGCAAGAFAEYLIHIFNDVIITGIDLDDNLLEIAKQNVPSGHFFHADANDLSMFTTDSFDLVTYLGTMTIFDDFTVSLNEALRVLSPGGMLIVFSFFNPYPVDTLVRWRYSGKDMDWHPGYNLFSLQTVSNYLDSHTKVKTYNFKRFELPFDLAPQEDPIRSWTEIDANNKRVFRNGIMYLDMYILSIEAKTTLPFV
jgi:ubiquinone/menaquinone biosynthesis C-methylase UbiE